MADTTTWALLEVQLGRLQTFYESARGAAASAYIPAGMWSSINARFTTAANDIAKLKANGVYGLAVINGVAGSAARWATAANNVGNTLSGILQDFDSEDLFSRAWTEIVVQTAADGRDVVVAATAAAPSIAGVVILVLVLLIVLKVVR